MSDRPLAYRIGFDADRHGATVTLADLRALVDACRNLPDDSPVLGLTTAPAPSAAPHLPMPDATYGPNGSHYPPATGRAPVTDLLRIAVGAVANPVRTDGTSAPNRFPPTVPADPHHGIEIALTALGVEPPPLGRVHIADIPSPATDDGRPSAFVRPPAPPTPVPNSGIGNPAFALRANPLDHWTVDEWAEVMDQCRAHQIKAGYDDAHDKAHGVRHLLNWSIDYARRGRTVESATLARCALRLLPAEIV